MKISRLFMSARCHLDGSSALLTLGANRPRVAPRSGSRALPTQAITVEPTARNKRRSVYEIPKTDLRGRDQARRSKITSVVIDGGCHSVRRGSVVESAGRAGQTRSPPPYSGHRK